MNVSSMIKCKVENSLEKRIIDLVRTDYSMVAGDKVRNMFARDIVKLVNDTVRDPHMVQVGQTL